LPLLISVLPQQKGIKISNINGDKWGLMGINGDKWGLMGINED
jgi:hypothetical protein